MAQTDDEKNRALLFAALLLLMQSARKQLTADITAFVLGSISLSALTEMVVSALAEAHTGATVLGRRLAGVGGADPTESDDAFAASVMDEQEEFLAGLFTDLREKRYAGADGSVDATKGLLAQRILLYALAVRATALESWVLAQPAGTVIEWVTTAGENCECCLSEEADSPHDAAAMTTFPGQCSCGPMCKCFLRIEGGALAFPFMSL